MHTKHFSISNDLFGETLIHQITQAEVTGSNLTLDDLDYLVLSILSPKYFLSVYMYFSPFVSLGIILVQTDISVLIIERAK